ncbi:MAG: hypothetical protein QM731_00465 [Chitinophagaceae bacterium]
MLFLFPKHVVLSLCIPLVALAASAQQNAFAGPMVMKNYPAAEKPQYNEEARTWYIAWRDSAALVVKLEIIDAVQQRKILMNGMELWIDVKGKKNKKTGVVFPIAEKPKASSPQQWSVPSENASGEKKSNSEQLAKQVGALREMQLIGFSDELNGRQNHEHPSGLQTSLSVQGDTLVYIAIVPFKVLGVQDGNNITFGIGVIEKGIPFTGGGMGGDGPMMGDGPPPGGPPPGGMNGGDGSFFQMMEDNVFWYKLKVTAK